jgi:uncharacterized coiled-coil protein SlyX
MLEVNHTSMVERVATLEQRLAHLEGELQTVKANLPDDRLSMSRSLSAKCRWT